MRITDVTVTRREPIWPGAPGMMRVSCLANGEPFSADLLSLEYTYLPQPVKEYLELMAMNSLAGRARCTHERWVDVTGVESADLEEICAACSTTRRRDRTTGEVLT